MSHTSITSLRYATLGSARADYADASHPAPSPLATLVLQFYILLHKKTKPIQVWSFYDLLYRTRFISVCSNSMLRTTIAPHYFSTLFYLYPFISIYYHIIYIYIYIFIIIYFIIIIIIIYLFNYI